MARTLDATPLQAAYILEGEHIFNAPKGEVLMDDPRSPFYERPMGFYSEELRQRFIDSSVRIAGVGGGGLTLAAMLAKEGVRDFSIADIDRVDATNVGRIPMLTPADIGREKVEVAAELITKHNPSARVRVYDNGVQEDNVDEFVGYDAGNTGLTVVFDEVDLNAPEAALRLHRAARKFGKYVVAATDVDRGGMVTTFDPEAMGHTFEHYTGSKPGATEAEYLEKVTGFQLPTIPNIPKNATWGTFDATMKKAPLPTTLRSVLNATDLAMDEFEKLLTLDDKRYENPHFYPRIHAVNPSAGEDFVTRIPRVRSVLRVGQALLKDRFGLNPPTSYSLEQQAARIAYRQSIADSNFV
jgi:molybdopterin/thiamine biosynthesis adenylyltransferase